MRWEEGEMRYEQQRERSKGSRAPLGYNHSLSSEMTYKLAYSYARSLKAKKGKRQLSYANSDQRVIIKKNCQLCLMDLNRSPLARSLLLTLSAVFFKSNCKASAASTADIPT